MSVLMDICSTLKSLLPYNFLHVFFFLSIFSGQSPIDFSLGSSSQGRDLLGRGNKVMLQSSNRYIQEIRKRLEENAIACKEREKRQDRFLVEQLKVHEAQEVKHLA